MATLPLLNSFDLKPPELNTELKNILYYNGTILLADVKTAQLIGWSNLNKACRAYTIGSLAKLVSATALLEKHLILKDSIINCKGKEKIASRNIVCWNASGHGRMNLEAALSESCNIYFYTVLQKLSSHNIYEYFKKYHLEVPELIHELNYKNKTSIPDHGISSELGMGLDRHLLLSPLQMLSLSCSIARRGIYKPLWINKPSQREIKLDISDKTLSVIKDGMIASAEYGTSKEFKKNGFKAAAKTGSAPIDYVKTHGWCIGFVPYNDPVLAFCIFTDQGTGFSDAVPKGVKTLKLCQQLGYFE